MLFQYCCRSLFVSLLQDMPANTVTFYLLCNALPDAPHLSCVPMDTEGTVWFKWRQEKPEYCPFKEIPTVQITSLLLHCVMPTKTQNIQHEEDLASNEGVFSCVSFVTHLYKFPLGGAEVTGSSQYHSSYRYPIPFKITQGTCDSFKDLVSMSEHTQEKNTLQDHQLNDETPKEGFLNFSN